MDQPRSHSAPPATQFSPDYAWWWDGAEWKPAISPDHLWRWDGQRWIPAPHAAPRGGGAPVWLVVLISFGGIIVLTAILVFVVLLTMGNQIANVFSNVVAALGP